jgi:hypothetical protein
MAFQKGVSGNPKGRPPKGRTYADIIEKMGRRKVEGKAQKELLVERMFEALTTGRIRWDRNRVVELDGSEYVSLLKFMVSHVDGPLRPVEDNQVGSGSLTINVLVAPERPAELPDDVIVVEN